MAEQIKSSNLGLFHSSRCCYSAMLYTRMVIFLLWLVIVVMITLTILSFLIKYVSRDKKQFPVNLMIFTKLSQNAPPLVAGMNAVQG